MASGEAPFKSRNALGGPKTAQLFTPASSVTPPQGSADAGASSYGNPNDQDNRRPDHPERVEHTREEGSPGAMLDCPMLGMRAGASSLSSRGTMSTCIPPPHPLSIILLIPMHAPQPQSAHDCGILSTHDQTAGAWPAHQWTLRIASPIQGRCVKLTGQSTTL